MRLEYVCNFGKSKYRIFKGIAFEYCHFAGSFIYLVKLFDYDVAQMFHFLFKCEEISKFHRPAGPFQIQRKLESGILSNIQRTYV